MSLIEILAGNNLFFDEQMIEPVSNQISTESMAIPDVGKSTVLFQIPTALAKCTISPIPKEGGGITYKVLLYGIIGSAKEYMSLFRTCTKTKPDDDLIVYIDTPGGNLKTAISIKNSIASAQAGRIVKVAVGEIMSSGTVIFDCVDSADKRITCEIGKYAQFMYHMSQHAMGGNTTRIIDESQQLLSYMQDYLNDSVRNHCITQEEHDAIINKRLDVYITAKEMAERLNKQII